ncbi:phosphopyruvate hydratase [Nocardia sp. NPDC004722]
MGVIEHITARQLLDCKGRPMVEAEVRTSDGHVGRGAAPTGQSVGSHEAFVLRDNDPEHYCGSGVNKAIGNITATIAPALIGREIADQAGIDQAMIDLDGTVRKTRLGGNAIYSMSVACLRAAAATRGEPVFQTLARDRITTVPVPSFNMVNGGVHAGVRQAFNEFLVVPYRAANIYEAVEIGVVVFRALEKCIKKWTGESPALGKSFGYAAFSDDPRLILEIMRDAISVCGVTDTVAFALDCASSEMYDESTRTYELSGKRVDADDIIAYMKELTEEFNLLFVEDLLDENDWNGFTRATRELTSTVVLGDDLIVTNRERLRKAIELRAVDGFVLKPNQIGTISEALETFYEAKLNGLLAVPSGRSGGVIDDIVMDFSVGLGVPIQKNGAPLTGERIEKLNFLMRASEAIPAKRLADPTPFVRFER